MNSRGKPKLLKISQNLTLVTILTKKKGDDEELILVAPHMEPLKLHMKKPVAQVGVEVEGGFSLLQITAAVKIQNTKNKKYQ